ncbi:MAG TPA: PEP-CTERM sorting domain-containing protein [Candidatus Hypogeohydataceae bacterium YC40]
MRKVTGAPVGKRFHLSSEARRVTPAKELHTGEVSPGLLLSGINLGIDHGNLNGNPHPSLKDGPQDRSDKLLHPGSINHPDILESYVDDLNGSLAGFLTADNQLSARFDMHHTPEPSTLILLSSGLVGIIGLKREAVQEDVRNCKGYSVTPLLKGKDLDTNL